MPIIFMFICSPNSLKFPYVNIFLYFLLVSIIIHVTSDLLSYSLQFSVSFFVGNFLVATIFKAYMNLDIFQKIRIGQQ